MPAIIAGPVEPVNNLADELSRQIQSGQPTRATVGSRDVAFSWTTGAPPIVASHVNKVLSEGLSFNSVRVSPSGTPPAKVPEGGSKPSAIQLTAGTVALSKYAGLGVFSTEDALAADALSVAVYQTLISGALLAYDADVVDAIEGASGTLTASGGSWSQALLNGVAAVAGKGGRADLCVLNPGDYAEAVEPSGYQLDPTQATLMLFGMTVITSPAVTAGTALVLSSAAVTCAESVMSPVIVLDPYSGLATNEVRMAAEIFAGVVVNAPANIAKCTSSA